MASLRADGGWAYEGAAVVIDDLRADNSIRARPLREHGVVSSVTVLIGSPEAPMGVLTANTRSERPFREHDVDFLQSVAHMLGGAIGRLRYEDRIRHDALHDALTGLPNRTLLLDRLGEALKRAERENGHVAVFFLDLDNLKVLNDSLGHSAGDELLRVIPEGIETDGQLQRLVAMGCDHAQGFLLSRPLPADGLEALLRDASRSRCPRCSARSPTRSTSPRASRPATPSARRAIGMRLGEQLGLGDEDRSALFYALLLKDAGCSSNAARLSSLFAADDHATKRAMKVVDWSEPAALARYTWHSVTPGGSPLAKARQMRAHHAARTRSRAS